MTFLLYVHLVLCASRLASSHSWIMVGSWLAQCWVMVGAMLGDGWSNVVDGWCNVG